MKRVLIYSHDTFGLGNIRRMLEVARHLVQTSERISVLVVTGSPMLHAFRIPERIDYLKLPCLARNVEGRYGARSLPLDLAETVRLRANLIRSAIADFAPDLLLVDKKPFGVEDELAGALEALPRAVRRPKLVLLLRDILDSPEATARVWRKNGYFDAISTWYDRVLVVGSPDVFDLRREYEFPPFAAAKVAFCGYIAREPARTPREAMRQALQVQPHEPLVLVTPGGGEDGFHLVSTALRGLALLPARDRPRTHVVCGPEMPLAQREAIERAAADMPSVSTQVFCDDMMALIGAADVALTMGGYNTVCELLGQRRRAVVVPRVQPGSEQLLRAQRMSARGLLQMVHPSAATPHTLMRALRAQLEAHARHEPLPRLAAMHGLDEACRHLCELLGVDLPVARAAAPTAQQVAVATRPLPVGAGALAP